MLNGGRRAWLSVDVAGLSTVFEVARSRGGAVARGLVEAAAGQVITTDRFSGYNWLPLRQRQLCWAHLRRDFQAMIDRGGRGRVTGERLLCCAEDLFHRWQRVRDGTLRRSTFRQYLGVVRAMTCDELEAGRVCGCAKAAATCAELLKVEAALWTFARVEGVEPTNNAAERALRHAVQWRRASYGTDSEAGGRFVGNILSVVATCRQQGRNVLEFLTACCQATLHGSAAPSLLPAANA